MVSSHGKLSDYYMVNLKILTDFNFTLSDIEEMLPWEREVYLRLIYKLSKKEGT